VEPRNDEPRKEPEPRKEDEKQQRRFQIVKLEERIAPRKGGNSNGPHCYSRDFRCR
jgi:hypothetical protein